jgi:hypothetical protein
MMAEASDRHAAEIFPSDYTSWRYCIETKCGLALSPEFLSNRIGVLGDPHREETQRFVKLYGEPYHQQVLAWFQQAAAEV